MSVKVQCKCGHEAQHHERLSGDCLISECWCSRFIEAKHQPNEATKINDKEE